MKTRTKNHKAFRSEQALLDFARSYLSEGFPNPERLGCPPDAALRSFAIHPRNYDKFIGEHVTLCSPCFKAFSAYLAEARIEAIQRRQIRRVTWIRRSVAVIGSAMTLIVVGYLFIKTRTEPIVAPLKPPTTARNTQIDKDAYLPIVIDLSKVSPTRGAGGVSESAPQVIPSARVDLSLRLPLGSEEHQYSIRLAQKGNIAWSGSARARQQDGDTLLQTRADFSRVPQGRYDLQVVSSDRRLTVGVLIKAIFPENTGPRR